ncbi:flagellar hook-length control protein FliK [Leminorella grimontii]|uniref:flagellar hook-length control protein FliK n=1 Tax=Leminorella grimontii TaxID=82981 RepID=UPI00322030CF
MKNVSLATAPLTPNEGSDVLAALDNALGEDGQGKREFSLPQPLAEAASRLRAAKEADRERRSAQEEPQGAELQALMAMLLAQPERIPTTSDASTPDGNRLLQALSQVQSQLPSQPQSPLQLRAQAQAQAPSDAALGVQDAVKNASHDLSQAGGDTALAPKLQALMATLEAQNAPTLATPEQQARLSTFAAQNLQAVAPSEDGAHLRIDAARAEDAKAARRGVVAAKVEEKSSSPERPELPLPDVRQNRIEVRAQPLETKAVAAPAGQSDDWEEKLGSLLKDRIQFQISQQQQVSTIRLDPPSLGKLEIAIQFDAGRLTVHIDANQGDVYRSLQQFSEGLRQHLMEQNFVQVNVQVSSDGQSRQQQERGERQRQEEDVLSAATLSQDDKDNARNESVLIKV